jgi:hypothetical protein
MVKKINSVRYNDGRKFPETAIELILQRECGYSLPISTSSDEGK